MLVRFRKLCLKVTAAVAVECWHSITIFSFYDAYLSSWYVWLSSALVQRLHRACLPQATLQQLQAQAQERRRGLCARGSNGYRLLWSLSAYCCCCCHWLCCCCTLQVTMVCIVCFNNFKRKRRGDEDKYSLKYILRPYGNLTHHQYVLRRLLIHNRQHSSQPASFS